MVESLELGGGPSSKVTYQSSLTAFSPSTSGTLHPSNPATSTNTFPNYAAFHHPKAKANSEANLANKSSSPPPFAGPGTPQPLILTMLPPEIHLMIISYFGYPTRSKLRAVNRYFARIIELGPFLRLKEQYIERCFAIETDDIRNYLERPNMGREDLFYRCFTCFKVQTANNFDISHRDGMLVTDIGSIQRFCIKCGIKLKWAPGEEVGFFLDNAKFGIIGSMSLGRGGHRYVFCGSCKKLKEGKGGPWKNCRDCWKTRAGTIGAAFEVKPASRYKEKSKQVMAAFQQPVDSQSIGEAPKHLTEEGPEQIEVCQGEEETGDLKLADVKLSHSLELYALWKDAEAWRKMGPGGHQSAVGR